MKKIFSKANIIIENRKNGVQPAMLIIEDGRIYMVKLHQTISFL